MSFRGRGGGGGRGRGGRNNFGGGGGRGGGFNRGGKNFDQGPPERVIPLGNHNIKLFYHILIF